jgi:hypothetical protein
MSLLWTMEYAQTLYLDQISLVENVEIANRRGRSVMGAFGTFGLRKVQSKNEDVNQRNSEVDVELNLGFLELNVFIHLEVLGDVFAAGIRILLLILPVFTVIHWHIHATVQEFFTKTDLRLHRMAHAKMCSLRHPNGGEEHKKGERYGENCFH